MKKLIALAAIVFFIFSAAYFTSCNNSSEKSAEDTAADSIQQVIKHGEYLATNVAMCMHCHSQRDFTKYAGPTTTGTEGGGGQLFDEKFGLPGKIYSKNITPDNETGIGTWTDDELLRAMTQGIRKNGDTLFPLMPYPNYNRIAKEDLLSIIAYIRTLKPIKNKVPERQLMMPIAAAYPGQYLQASVDGNAKPSGGDVVKYGEYLITMADCGTCHSPLTPQGPDMSRKYAGGYLFELASNKVQSANITPDTATGIGGWTEERFLNKFLPFRKEEAYNIDPGKQNTVMPVIEIAGMKDSDLKAIYAYLRTVKPITNLVEKFPK